MLFWKLLISLKATVPARKRCFFLVGVGLGRAARMGVDGRSLIGFFFATPFRRPLPLAPEPEAGASTSFPFPLSFELLFAMCGADNYNEL